MKVLSLILLMFIAFCAGGSFGLSQYETAMKKQINTAKMIEVDGRFYAVYEIHRDYIDNTE